MTAAVSDAMPRRAKLAALGGALAALAAVLALYPPPPELWRLLDFNGAPFEDFMGPYLETARALPGARLPADGYHYPATFALLLAPLARLGPAAASWAWLAVQVAAGLALVLVPLRIVVPRSAWEAAAWGALAATAQPLLHGVYWGQVSAPLAALLLVGVAAGARGRGALEGALVGVATAVKLVPALFLLGPALRGDRRALGYGLAVAALLLVVPPVLLMGPGDALAFHREVAARLAALGERVADPALGVGSQDLAAAFSRWVPLEGSFALGRILGLALALKLVTRLPSLDDAGLRFAHLAPLGPLLVAPTWSHGLVALVPAAWFTWRGGGMGARTAALASLVVLGMGPHALAGSAAAHAASGWGAVGLVLSTTAALLASRPAARA